MSRPPRSPNDPSRGPRSGSPRPPRPPRGLFGDVVTAPDRDHCPGAAPVISFRDDDDPEFLRELGARAPTGVELVRRGVWHGAWAVLDPLGLVPPVPKRKELRAQLAWRWHAGRPVILPAALARGSAGAFAPVRTARLALGAELRVPGRLRAFVRERLEGEDGARLRLGDEPAPLADPERDVERVLVAVEGRGGDAGTPLAGDLWVKTGRLSTHPEDASLRLRVSFGAEGADDDSDDEPRHALVAELGARLLPETRLLGAEPDVARLLRMFTGGEVLLTQPIAYWNAPGGGALFHHDAFRDEPGGQRGVAYLQLVGRTAWLALSTEDLGTRVRELVEAAGAGDFPWLPDELGGEAWNAARRLARDAASLRAELVSPGCGALAPLVNRPELTALLADAGHASLLEPGDAILLPNHGYPRTAMHSVFCAGDRTAYGISQALRRAPPAAV